MLHISKSPGMKTLVLTVLFLLLFISLPDYWYMAPEQRRRFTKIDSLQNQREKLERQRDEWMNMWRKDKTKLDSLAPLIRKHCAEIDRNLDLHRDILIEAGDYVNDFYSIGK